MRQPHTVSTGPSGGGFPGSRSLPRQGPALPGIGAPIDANIELGTSRPGRTPGIVSRWVLLVVLLQYLVLLGFFLKGAWERRSPESPLTMTGERLVIFGDGLGYYAWLRSLLIDQDWDFDNEFDEHNPLGTEVVTNRTPLGRRANPFSVGPACLWAPAVLAAHALRLNGVGAHWPANGYSVPYQAAVGLSAILLAVAGVAGLYRIGRLYARPATASLVTAFLVFGTTIFNYTAIEMTTAHGAGLAVTALLVWFWLRTYGSQRALRWLAVGALVGLAALMRWQLAALAVLPAGEWALGIGRAWRDGTPPRILSRSAHLVLAALASWIVFLPQVIAWKAVYGEWLVSPMHLAHNWWQPDWARVLVSTDRSFFYWTPLTVLLVLGSLLCLWPGGRAVGGRAIHRGPLALLLIAFAVQVYLLAGISGNGVYLGAAFGFRQLTESLVLLVPGMALLLEAGPPSRRLCLVAVCLLLSAWNMLLVAQYHFGLVPHDGGATPATLWHNATFFVQTYPRESGYFLIGSLLLAPVLIWAPTEKDSSPDEEGDQSRTTCSSLPGATPGT
jgi:hypothetical protein